MNPNRTSSAAAAAIVMLCGQAMGQGYTIQVLPPLPGYAESFACGINEAGNIVGASRSGTAWRPTRWQNGLPVDLGSLPGWSQIVCLDISNDGTTIVGEAWDSSVVVPFVWESGVMAQIPGPVGGSAGCWQINDNGVIIGRGWISANVACRWDRSSSGWVYTELARLPGTIGAGAFGINNADVIAGFCANGSWSTAQATGWQGATPGAFPGFPNGATLTSINMSGQAVGDFEVTPGGAWRAQRHDGVTFTDLGTQAYPNSYAHRVNSAGVIVGQSYADGVDPTGFPNDNKRAIIWRLSGTMSAVNDVIPAGSGWDVKQLQDVNDSGRIVGLGRFNGLWRGCLLTPICYANCDASTTAPVLNVNDFVCFQQRFAAADPYANCDNSTTIPILNVNDFVCFQQQFAAGCK